MNIVLFDGLCNFCDASVQILIKYDKLNNLKFASQQSDFGAKLLAKYQYSSSLDSIIFIKENTLYTKSDAIIQICKLLSGAPKAIQLFQIIPKSLRDFLYSIFAKNRYKIFGKENECILPSPEIREKFLE